jgi:hypothetical protein
MGDPTWTSAWYPLTSKYEKVEDILKVRDRNRGEYRENPCYHDEMSYENGYGIALFPRRLGSDGRRAHFARYSDKDNERAIRKLSESIGFSPSNIGIYTNSVLRVSTMIRNINRGLKDNLTTGMNIFSCEQVKKDGIRNPLDIPDFIITHNPTKEKTHPNQTKLFIKENNRKPNFEVNDSNDWILNITKWETNLVMEWASAKSLFLKEWSTFMEKYKKMQFINDQPPPDHCVVIATDPRSRWTPGKLGGSSSWRTAVRDIFGWNPAGKYGTQTVKLVDNRREATGYHGDYRGTTFSGIPLSHWLGLRPGTPIIIGKKYISKYVTTRLATRTEVRFYSELLDYPRESLPEISPTEFSSSHWEDIKHGVWDKGEYDKAWSAYKKDDVKEYIRICKKNKFEPKIDVKIDIKWRLTNVVIREGKLSDFEGYRVMDINNAEILISRIENESL